MKIKTQIETTAPNKWRLTIAENLQGAALRALQKHPDRKRLLMAGPVRVFTAATTWPRHLNRAPIVTHSFIITPKASK